MKINKLRSFLREYDGILLYCLISFALIVMFKIAVDKWNRDATEYNEYWKKHCPCGKWHYVTKGDWVCDCPEK